jgi:hypothetical protein
MNDELIPDLVALIDLAESKTTSSFSWKPQLNAILDEIAAVNAAAASQATQTGNPLFGLLAKQNQILMSLVLLVLIAGTKR